MEESFKKQHIVDVMAVLLYVVVIWGFLHFFDPPPAGKLPPDEAAREIYDQAVRFLCLLAGLLCIKVMRLEE